MEQEKVWQETAKNNKVVAAILICGKGKFRSKTIIFKKEHIIILNSNSQCRHNSYI